MQEVLGVGVGGPTGASLQFLQRNCLRCKALTGGLLRGKESIRQGSLQSGQLLKMQQHHYGLTQPRTSVSLAARLCVFPSDIHLSISPLWILSAATICSLLSFFDILSHSAPLHIIHPPFSSLPHSAFFFFCFFFYYNTGKLGERASLTRSPCERWPAEGFFFFSLFFPPLLLLLLLFDTASHRSAYATVPGTRIEQPTEYNKWTYMGG